ncbi:MAG TPA: hypothetical protein VFL80_02610 [Thermoanaerobaculia bacterium]|nr:hypothetical protein [Thermoanaerobaculia bacterium]
MSQPAKNGGVAFRFRPWVRRAGLSIVLVAGAATASLAGFLGATRSGWSWSDERALWIYIALLWLGGLKIVAATRTPIAEVSGERLVIRPLHQWRRRSIRWGDVLGTEQMVGGDRLIVYYDTKRGMRFVAINLNLIKGRREFLALIEQRLRAFGFEERVVDRSRYLARPGRT